MEETILPPVAHFIIRKKIYHARLPKGHEELYPSNGKFASYLLKHYYPVDFVFSLSVYTASVCLPGYGFFEPEAMDYGTITEADRNNWSIRASIANQGTDQYKQLGLNIAEVLEKYYYEFYPKKKTAKGGDHETT